MTGVRRLGRGLLWPMRRLLDPRFADVGRRIDYARDQILAERAELERGRQQLEDAVNAFGAASSESLAFLGRQMRDFEAALASLEQRVEALGGWVGPLAYSRRIEEVVAGGADGLDADTARLLNHAESHVGFAAERRLWLNPPLSLAYADGDVRLGSVNERIAEIAWAFRALGDVAPPARVLDVGSVESTVPLSLASLGYRVCALDLRPYPFEHPNLEVAVSRLEDFERGPGAFDAILCISTLEHVGLGWYGEPALDDGADRGAMDRMRALLSPGGPLVLTVPFGRAGVDAVQRTYDDPALDTLLDGWTVEAREVVVQQDDRTWLPGRPDRTDQRAVALVVARRPAAG